MTKRPLNRIDENMLQGWLKMTERMEAGLERHMSADSLNSEEFTDIQLHLFELKEVIVSRIIQADPAEYAVSATISTGCTVCAAFPGRCTINHTK